MNLRSYIHVGLLFCLIITNFVSAREIHQRERRSILSLPSDSSLYVTTDLIIPVLPLLNSTNTYLWFNFPVTFDVPTAKDLNKLYASFSLTGKEGEKRATYEAKHNLIEEKRANHDRRKVYKYLEGFLQK